MPLLSIYLRWLTWPLCRFLLLCSLGHLQGLRYCWHSFRQMISCLGSYSWEYHIRGQCGISKEKHILKAANPLLRTYILDVRASPIINPCPEQGLTLMSLHLLNKCAFYIIKITRIYGVGNP